MLYFCLFIFQDEEPAKPKEAAKRKAEPAADEEDDDEPIVKKSAADFANQSFDSPRGMLINNLSLLTKFCT